MWYLAVIDIKNIKLELLKAWQMHINSNSKYLNNTLNLELIKPKQLKILNKTPVLPSSFRIQLE